MQTDDPALIAAKQDLQYLKLVLGLNGTKTADSHSKCPLCAADCLSYAYQASTRSGGQGAYVFNCKKGCARGTVIDALVKVGNLDIKTAIKEAKERYKGGRGLPAPRPMLALPAPQEDLNYGKMSLPPVLDMAVANDFVGRYNEFLLGNMDLSAKFRRGISEDVVRKYRIGFVQGEKIKVGYAGGTVLTPAAWVLPITDENGQMMAVKLHVEKPAPVFSNGPFKGKSLWMPFGTAPTYDKATGVKPRIAYQCLWPHISQQASGDPEKGSFGRTLDWYIDRIPQGSELDSEWRMKVEEERAILSLEIRRTEAEFENGDFDKALLRAWDFMKAKIMRSITHQPEIPRDVPLDMSRYYAIVTGELKALAGISAGVIASSNTGGEGWIPPPAMLAPYKDKDVIVVVDEDPPKKIVMTNGEVNRQCTGLDYGRKLSLALLREGASDVRIKTGGKTE